MGLSRAVPIVSWPEWAGVYGSSPRHPLRIDWLGFPLVSGTAVLVGPRVERVCPVDLPDDAIEFYVPTPPTPSHAETDSGVKSGMSLRELISTSKQKQTKKAQAGNE